MDVIGGGAADIGRVVPAHFRAAALSIRPFELIEVLILRYGY
jgi:hypothetical protein